MRIAYSFDRGWHRQTGETGFLQLNGEPFDAFPNLNPLVAANGDILQKRDRRLDRPAPSGSAANIAASSSTAG